MVTEPLLRTETNDLPIAILKRGAFSPSKWRGWVLQYRVDCINWRGGQFCKWPCRWVWLFGRGIVWRWRVWWPPPVLTWCRLIRRRIRSRASQILCQCRCGTDLWRGRLFLLPFRCYCFCSFCCYCYCRLHSSHCFRWHLHSLDLHDNVFQGGQVGISPNLHSAQYAIGNKTVW